MVHGVWDWIDLTSAIMREMAVTPSHWNTKRSYTDIGRRLGVDEETVKNRLRMMKEMGILRGWRLIVNARMLQMESSNLMLEFPSPESKESAIPRIKEMNGVVLIQNFYGNALQVTRFNRGQEDLNGVTKEILPLSKGVNVLTYWKVKLPRCEHKPREIDWMIIGVAA